MRTGIRVAVLFLVTAWAATAPAVDHASAELIAEPQSDSGVPGSSRSFAGPGAEASFVDAPSSEGTRNAPKATASWPFLEWDHALGVTFNPFPARPGVPLRAFGERGWSPHLVERKTLTEAQGREALALLRLTRGDIEVSKCPFPRHAVVLLHGETPVASINVCFECGDILIWPDWKRSRRSSPSMAEMKQKMRGYKKAFPRWERFFQAQLGFAIER